MLHCLIITKLILCYNYWINNLLISFIYSLFIYSQHQHSEMQGENAV